MIQQEWKIKPRSGVCCVTGRAFVDKEPFYTAIFDDGGEDGLVRRDYSAEAWPPAPVEAVEGQVVKRKLFSHWRSLFEAPKPEGRRDVVEKESAEGLLRRLIQDDEPSSENARFILALMLERKKTLKETDSQSLPDGMLRIYEHGKTGEVFIVKDPLLKMEQIAAVQEQVADLLASKTQANPTDQTEIPDLIVPSLPNT